MCTQLDFVFAAKKRVGPAYLGAGLPNYYSPSNFAAFSSGYYQFINNMWNSYQQFGCSWFQNRVSHWNSQLTGPPPITTPYHINRKLAKISYAQELHLLCGCTGPVPI